MNRKYFFLLFYVLKLIYTKNKSKIKFKRLLAEMFINKILTFVVIQMNDILLNFVHF